MVLISKIQAMIYQGVTFERTCRLNSNLWLKTNLLTQYIIL